MSFLRLYPGFGFLVSMIEGVFADIGYFISFYLIVVVMYGCIFTLMLTSITGGKMDIEEYSGIGLVGYFIMSFRTSMGDF